jgi:hypothetical protein
MESQLHDACQVTALYADSQSRTDMELNMETNNEDVRYLPP